MLIVVQQLLILYIFLALGWLFGKLKPSILTKTELISFLIVNLMLPCKILGSFSKNFTVQYISENYVTLLVSVALLIILHFGAIAPAKWLKRNDYEEQVYSYSITIPNFAYMGYVLAESIFGSQALTDMILFCIPFSLYTNTVGYIKLTGEKKGLKALISPMTVSILIGMILGLTSVKIPNVLQTVISNSSGCLGPLSMLLTGMTLSSLDLRSLFSNIREYVMVGLRLVVIPLLVFLLFQIPFLTPMLSSAMLLTAMPNGLNPIIFAKNAGKSPDLGARLALVSHLLSCITVPIWLSIIS